MKCCEYGTWLIDGMWAEWVCQQGQVFKHKLAWFQSVQKQLQILEQVFVQAKNGMKNSFFNLYFYYQVEQDSPLGQDREVLLKGKAQYC